MRVALSASHDIKSSLTIALIQHDAHFTRHLSLDWSDDDTEAYIASVLKEHPRKLHEAVAANFLAATRCFHWTVKLVIRIVFNCDDSPGEAMDPVVAQAILCIFGHVRAYYRCCRATDEKGVAYPTFWCSYLASVIPRICFAMSCLLMHVAVCGVVLPASVSAAQQLLQTICLSQRP